MSLFPTMSDAFRAAASSRRSRLDFIDSAVLMRRTRHQLFCFRWPADHVVNVLRHLTTRGCEEAVWLLGMLTSEGPMPVTERHGKAQVVSCKWLAEIVAREDSPRAWFYRARLLYCEPPEYEEMVIDLLRRAAEAGFAPAMISLAVELSGDERLSWLRKAAALHDPDALSMLADYDEPSRFALHLEAANLGNTESMGWLAGSSESGLSLLHCAVWRARGQFLRGTLYVRSELRDAVKRMATGGRIVDDERLVHAVGRELEGFEHLWPKESLEDDHLRCVDFYLRIVHTARRAALQTVVAMRERRMPRDVASLIARVVYDSRDDAVAWCERGQIARKQSGTTKKRRK